MLARTLFASADDGTPSSTAEAELAALMLFLLAGVCLAAILEGDLRVAIVNLR